MFSVFPKQIVKTLPHLKNNLENETLKKLFFRETSVQTAVVAAYKRLYIESANMGNKINPVQLVRNLAALVSGANIGDLTGLEELIGMLVKSKDLDKNCFQVS